LPLAPALNRSLSDRENESTQSFLSDFCPIPMVKVSGLGPTTKRGPKRPDEQKGVELNHIKGDSIFVAEKGLHGSGHETPRSTIRIMDRRRDYGAELSQRDKVSFTSESCLLQVTTRFYSLDLTCPEALTLARFVAAQSITHDAPDLEVP